MDAEQVFILKDPHAEQGDEVKSEQTEPDNTFDKILDDFCYDCVFMKMKSEEEHKANLSKYWCDCDERIWEPIKEAAMILNRMIDKNAVDNAIIAIPMAKLKEADVLVREKKILGHLEPYKYNPFHLTTQSMFCPFRESVNEEMKKHGK